MEHKSIINRWFTLFWNKYLDSEDFYMDGIGYLILDKATLLIDEDIIRLQTSDYRFISFIPADLTRYLQSLDVSVAILKNHSEKNMLIFALKIKLSKLK